MNLSQFKYYCKNEKTPDIAIRLASYVKINTKLLFLDCRQCIISFVIFNQQCREIMEKQMADLIHKKYNVACIANDIKSDMTTNGDGMEEFEDYWREDYLNLKFHGSQDWELSLLKKFIKIQMKYGNHSSNN